MSEAKPEAGSLVWIDLTVEDAEEVRDFYTDVVGWTSAEVDMGGYADYTMKTGGSGATITGVCHARGVNADIPPAWMPYFAVADLDESMRACIDNGGELMMSPKGLGEGRFCVIRDPAGAFAALFEA